MVSLFLEDSTRQSTQCKQKFIEWRGPEIAYLGRNQWAFSAAGPHDVVFSCPVGVRHLPPRTIHLPSSEIFEVPAGCTAKTEDWVFPASLEGRLEASLSPIIMPTLPPSSLNGTFSLPVAVTTFQQQNVSALNFISDLLTRNNDARLSSEMTGVQIKNLIRTTEANTGVWSNRCPFELLIALTILTFAVLYLCRQLLWLRARMVAHEWLALQDFSTPPLTAA